MRKLCQELSKLALAVRHGGGRKCCELALHVKCDRPAVLETHAYKGALSIAQQVDDVSALATC
jgi:hypothetical protein